MTYAEIVNRIANNLGKDNQSSVFTSITKLDIIDAMDKIYRKVEPVKVDFTATITIAASSLTLAASNPAVPPTTPLTYPFLVPLEVLFFNSDGQRFPCKELQYEEYIRWNPDVTADQTSFGQFDITSTPMPLLYTQENFDFDGLVGYAFSDTNPQQLLWKPAIAGSVKIYYVTYENTLSALTASPNIHRVFSDLIVLTVTIKQLTRILGGITDQIKLFATTRQITEFKEELAGALKDYAGFVNRDASTPVITPFDFLNDYNMLILS